ncbi:MAG: TetR/AcrR family transcriptional regulator [Pseudomonadota bacterium]
MPAPKTPRADAVDAITRVFREYGFDGASLSRLSEASGLGRSSLYHHFPNGKDDMAKAAVDHINSQFEELVLGALNADGAPADRVKKAAAGLSKFYEGGRSNCLVNLFSFGDATEFVPGSAKAMARGVEDAFTAIAKEAGFAGDEARLRAEQALIEIEGSLVVSHAKGAVAPFQRALARLPGVLTGA